MTLGAEGSPTSGDHSHRRDGPRPTAVVLCADQDTHRFAPEVFAAIGLNVLFFHDTAAAKAACNMQPPRVLVLPVSFRGIDLAPQVAACKESGVKAVIMIAASDQIDGAAEAMNAGADDCLFEPFSGESLKRALVAALRNAEAPPRQTPPPAAPSPPLHRLETDPTQTFFGMIGTSADMREVFRKVEAIANFADPVVIHGDIGTGKSTLARVIHDRSTRAGGPFVHLACDGLSDARDGAGVSPVEGPLVQAQGGTLYLDRVDTLPPGLQKQLFTALKAHEQNPDEAPDTRIVASLALSAHDALGGGHLREDLYYLLKVAEFTLPALRDRPVDFAPLLAAFLTRAARDAGRPVPALETAAFDVLSSYSWPGNLRELSNLVRGLLVTQPGPRITLAHLPPNLRHQTANARLGASSQGVGALIGQPLAAIERAVIEATIAAEGGSVPRAARVLDLSPSTIYRKREGWEKNR